MGAIHIVTTMLLLLTYSEWLMLIKKLSNMVRITDCHYINTLAYISTNKLLAFRLVPSVSYLHYQACKYILYLLWDIFLKGKLVHFCMW